MNARKWLSLFICFVMVFTCITPAFANSGVSLAADVDDSVWTPEDFTYGEYEKLLYGCDYSRQFTIKGLAITGFSESGEEKFKTNKALVIPATNPEGEPIVAIGPLAFKDKGLTSVEFPTGMMVSYDDTITEKVTKRGNFIIAENAFSGNNLTSVTLPEGVIAVLSHAFNNNKIETVKFPRTIWWIETLSFANNRITDLNFPTTCDFQLEMHGMAFAKNFIKAVRLPDFTEVVNKDTFFLNIGMEPIIEAPKDEYKTYEVDGVTYDAGIVYMYADNSELEVKDRIHHIEQTTASKKSYVQKLVINDGLQHPFDENAWVIDDFTVEGTVITGLSESGIAKRKVNKDLVIPELTADYRYVTEIAAASPAGYGLFATETEKFNSVYLPTGVKKIGDFAFQNSGLKEVTFPWTLTTIGNVAFQSNELTSVILPDTVTTLGSGAFATNQKLERISLSTGMTAIPEAAFGCSDNTHYMTNLKSIDIHEGITEIGVRAFAGNNFSKIEIPSTVEKIGNYAFSTKNYLTTPCELILNEGLIEIGSRAFRNKVIYGVIMPESVEKIKANTFEKAYSDNTSVAVTKIFVSLPSQYEDATNFPASDYHKVYMIEELEWKAEDFEYGTQTFEISSTDGSEPRTLKDAYVVKGLSASGLEKLLINKDIVIPQKDNADKKIEGVGDGAFKGLRVKSVTTPETSDFCIGKEAFYGCGLEYVDLQEGVIYLGDQSFEKNTLVYVEFPATISFVGHKAFADNSINNLEFPEETQRGLQIGTQAFAFNKIRAVQLPANTEKVGVWAFLQNTGMEALTTDKAEEKGSGIVYMHLDIEDITQVSSLISHNSSETSPTAVQKLVLGKIPDITEPWSLDDFIYDESTGTLLGWSEIGQLKRLQNRALILPDKTPGGKNIVAIGESAFKIPDDEVIITKFGIDSPNGMTSVVLPSKVTNIGEQAFSQNALTTVDLSTVTSIGYRAFYGNDLTKVELPDTVIHMGAGAFATNNITELKLSKGVTVIPQGAFSMNIRLENVIIPDTVTEIGTTAFAGARLTSLTIPESVTKIGVKAFHLHHLTELTIPGNVKELGDSAFEGTYKATTLTKLTIEEGVEIIGDNCFKEALLETVHFPNSIKRVGTNLFLNNKGLDGSKVVEVTTNNYEHTKFVDKTYTVKYLTPSIENFADGVILEYTEKVYTGSPMEPTVTIDGLTENVDFTVIYSNNINVGTATVTIKGIDKYTGVIIKHFKINERYNPFIDIKKNTFYYDAVLWAVENKITDGVSPNKFAPDETCTRGQIVTFLWRAAGEPKAKGSNPFIDVKNNSYYAEAVKWAAENGITDGVSPNKFAPDAPCTRGQIVTFLWRAAGEPEANVNNVFVDVKNNTYYSEAVKWALEKGITDGVSPNKFAPDAPCTRGQVVTFLYRAEK